MSKILFQEKQKFTQWWLWVLFLAPVLYFLYDLIGPMFETVPNTSGNKSFSLVIPYEYGLGLIFVLVSFLILVSMSMTTKIDTNKISLTHLFLFKKEIPFYEIDSVKIITYGFVGYGIRLSIKHGTVYNVKGNRSLSITHKNGKKCLIGTQRPEELAAAVESVLKLM